MIKELFLAVVNMSVTASFVIFAVMALRLLFRKQPKIYSYLLWSMVLFRLLCPYSFSLDTSAFNLLPAKQTATGQIEYTVPDFIAENVAPQTEMPTEDVVIAPEVKDEQNLVVSPQQNNTPVENVIVVAPQEKVDWIKVLSVIWFFGGLYIFLNNLISLHGIKEQLADSRQLYGNVYKNSTITTAFIIGVFAPCIYLPENLTERQQRYIVFHEEMHLKRKDYLLKFMGFVALCIHWFNPLVWLAYYLAEKDMEMSCDEAVIRYIGNGEKQGYSQTLLSLALPVKEYRAMHLAFGEGETKQRIVNVLSFKKPKAKYVVGTLCIIALAGVLLVSNPAQFNALELIGHEDSFTDIWLFDGDDYFSVSGGILHTATDNLKKTKITPTEEFTNRTSDNFIYCKAEDKNLLLNFSDDYSKLWVLDETNENNGRIYNVIKPERIKGFIQSNAQHRNIYHQIHSIIFPTLIGEHLNCVFCNSVEEFMVQLSMPDGWHIYEDYAVNEGGLCINAVRNKFYIVDDMGEAVGAIGFGVPTISVDSADSLMTYITDAAFITFDKNDMRVWPDYGESVFTTCSYSNAEYDNYCALIQRTGVKPYVMLCFIPEKVDRTTAEDIARSAKIMTADGGTIRAGNTTFWIKPDEPETIMAQTAVSVYLKEIVTDGTYKISATEYAKAGNDAEFDYPHQIFAGYDYVVKADFTVADNGRSDVPLEILLYIDKITDCDFEILGYVETDKSIFYLDEYEITEQRLIKTMYGSTTLRNDNMTLGTYEIVAGEKGLNYERVEYTYQNGVVVREEIYESTVIKESKDEVVNMGTVWNGTVIQGGTGKIVWPTAAGYVSRGFVDQYPRHNGLDIAAPTGTHIYAADTGVVTKALYTNVGNGIYCEIDHGGYQTLYAHCNELFVEVGQSVQQGQLIAAVGSTGNSTGPHLHFEVKKGDTRYNPYDWL